MMSKPCDIKVQSVRALEAGVAEHRELIRVGYQLLEKVVDSARVDEELKVIATPRRPISNLRHELCFPQVRPSHLTHSPQMLALELPPSTHCNTRATIARTGFCAACSPSVDWSKVCSFIAAPTSEKAGRPLGGRGWNSEPLYEISWHALCFHEGYRECTLWALGHVLRISVCTKLAIAVHIAALLWRGRTAMAAAPLAHRVACIPTWKAEQLWRHSTNVTACMAVH